MGGRIASSFRIYTSALTIRACSAEGETIVAVRGLLLAIPVQNGGTARKRAINFPSIGVFWRAVVKEQGHSYIQSGPGRIRKCR